MSVSALPAVSLEEKARASQYLMSTREKLLAVVENLSDSQWHFQPTAGRWSIAQILEHVGIVEQRIHKVIGKMSEAPAAEPGRNAAQVDEQVLADTTKRTVQLAAPPQVQPTGQPNPEELLKDFLASRSQTLQLLASSPFLRGRVLPHPVFGPWDGYQWILAAGGHSERHTAQILEVKSHLEFPKYATPVEA